MSILPRPLILIIQSFDSDKYLPMILLQELKSLQDNILQLPLDHDSTLSIILLVSKIRRSKRHRRNSNPRVLMVVRVPRDVYSCRPHPFYNFLEFTSLFLTVHDLWSEIVHRQTVRWKNPGRFKNWLETDILPVIQMQLRNRIFGH